MESLGYRERRQWTDTIIRVTPSGQISELPIPRHESGPNEYTAGWGRKRLVHRVFSVTKSVGSLRSAKSLNSKSRLIMLDFRGSLPGPEGNLWFTEGAANKIGCITPAGQITEFALPMTKGHPGQIVAGSDGRLWFTDGYGAVGRITPPGRYTQIKVSGEPVGIASGPEGQIWNSASSEGACHGGGGTCESRTITGHGIIGRITPGPLTAEILSARARVRDGKTKVRIACQGGDANSVCRGRVALTWSITHRGSVGLFFLAKRRFQLAADSTRSLTWAEPEHESKGDPFRAPSPLGGVAHQSGW